MQDRFTPIQIKKALLFLFYFLTLWARHKLVSSSSNPLTIAMAMLFGVFIAETQFLSRAKYAYN